MGNAFFVLTGIIALAGGGYLVGFNHGTKFAIKKYQEFKAEVL